MSLKRGLNSLFRRKVKDKNSDHEDEREEMIDGINELEITTVKDVMVPRVDVSFVSLDNNLSEISEIIKENGYSRYPVYQETIDHVVGMLYVKDLVPFIIDSENKNFSVKKVMRDRPYYIPDTKKLDDLLTEFKLRKVHIAVAIDEYGGVSGIISMEDILEVIVGEIQDEYDDEQEAINKVSDNIYIIDGRTSLDEINENLDLDLNDEESETIGGYVFALFGNIPNENDSIEDENNICFTVLKMEGHKINRVKININKT